MVKARDQLNIFCMWLDIFGTETKVFCDINFNAIAADANGSN